METAKVTHVYLVLEVAWMCTISVRRRRLVRSSFLWSGAGILYREKFCTLVSVDWTASTEHACLSMESQYSCRMHDASSDERDKC